MHLKWVFASFSILPIFVEGVCLSGKSGNLFLYREYFAVSAESTVALARWRRSVTVPQ
jgi:hypothetical protein